MIDCVLQTIVPINNRISAIVLKKLWLAKHHAFEMGFLRFDFNPNLTLRDITITQLYRNLLR